MSRSGRRGAGRLRDRLASRATPSADNPAARLFLEESYVARENPTYFDDALADESGIVHQPDVYPFAAHIARLCGRSTLIDLGCGRAHKLAPFAPEFDLVGVDYGRNLAEARRRFPNGRWIEWNLERPEPLPLPETDVSDAVVICADVIEHLRDPLPLLRNLRCLLDEARFALLSTPERGRARGGSHRGPPDNASHVREWSLYELERLLEWAGFRVSFIGLTASHDDGYPKATTLAVLTSPTGPVPAFQSAPDGFRVVAVMPAYNEADVIEDTIGSLAAEGVDVYVLDNWSTDGTSEIAANLFGRGVIGIERFPASGPSSRYEWKAMLTRTEELTESLAADWLIQVDADERRRAPWPGVTLRDAVYFADRCGFNCIDHTVLIFHPTDDEFRSGDVERHFRCFEFGRRPGHFLQRKAWKNMGVRPVRAESGGHDTVFPGRRIYPFKFLLKHYPIRSQRHGERKVFRERIDRFDADERAAGWHVHYDAIDEGHGFILEPSELLEFEEEEFEREYLVERLSGIGINRVDA